LERNILFVQLSATLRTAYERGSIMLEDYRGRSFLENLLGNLKQSERVDEIFVVTSDSSADNKIVEIIVERAGCKWLRIPSSSKFAFSEDNKQLSTTFLYPENMCGMFSAECFLHYTADRTNPELIEAELGVVLDGDMMPFADGMGIDRLLAEDNIDEALDCIKRTLTYDPMDEKICGKLRELADVG